MRLDYHRLSNSEEFEDEKVAEFYKSFGLLCASDTIPLRLAQGKKVLTLGMFIWLCKELGLKLVIEASDPNITAKLEINGGIRNENENKIRVGG